LGTEKMDFFRRLKAWTKTEPETTISPNMNYDIASNRLTMAIELLLTHPLDMKKWLALDLDQEYDSWEEIVIAYLSSKGVHQINYVVEYAHILLVIKYTDKNGQPDSLNRSAPSWVWGVENSLVAYRPGINTYEKITIYKKTKISATRAIQCIEQVERR
jgi:hypothetical protein